MSTVPVVVTTTADVAKLVDQREVDAVRRIIFFDGVCGLCNWSVDFVLKRDRTGLFQFAPLQGDTARSLLSNADVADVSTMVLWINGSTYRKSAATVRILWQLGVFWQIFGTVLWLIPLPIRNWVYSLIAINRYRLFGKKETCRLPTREERSRFLP